MKNEWRKYKLGELTTKITKGTTPSTVGGKFLPSGINYIKSEAVSYEGRIDTSTFVFIDDETHNKLRRSQLEKDDILFSMAGIFLGKTGIVNESMLPANTNQALAIIRLDKKLADSRFVQLFLRMPETVRFVNNMSAQSAQPNINLEEVGSLEIDLPPLREQQAIAEILSSLDDKIELNLQTNKTLEEMASTLYKHWFVDFGPFQNGKFIESELGLIPEGWEVKGLDDVAEFLNGLALQKFPPNGIDDLPVIKIREIKNGISNSTDYANNNIPEKYILKDGDIIFSWSGTLELVIWCNGRGALNQHLFKVTPNKLPDWLIYMYVNQHMENFKAIAANKATTMGHIQRIHLTEAKICIPKNEDLVNIDKLLSPIYDSIIRNNIENQTLKQTRDYLLPKLISGEIRVKDAAKAVKEIV
ncbi:MAG: restriction endonuclease subunit S [Bacteroidetes bacterium]|nr:restriction endonuclease subunit S [Bacteroidota bacterium]